MLEAPLRSREAGFWRLMASDTAVRVRSTSLCHRSIQDTLTVRRPRLSVVSTEQTTAEPSKTEAVLFGTRI